MTEPDAGSQMMAGLALALLDAGALDELRALLVEQLESRIDTWAPGNQLQLVAAECAIGLPVTGIGRMLHGAPVIDPGMSLLESVDSYAAIASARLTNEALGMLQLWIGENTEQLLSARTCLAAVSLAGAPAALTRAQSPLEKYLLAAAPASDRNGREYERGWILELLSAHSAARTTNERATKRVVYWARMAGLTQREVAESMHRPQTHVFRQLQEIDADPRALAMTPRELHDHYRAGHVDRTQFLALLAAYPYESGTFPADAPDWGYVPGSFDELTQLAAEGSISHEELDVVLAGIEALAVAHE